MASNATLFENKIKDKLGIRWVDARRLVQDAQKQLSISDDQLIENEDEIMLAVLKSFVALPKEEQEALRRKKVEAAEEPEWKRKAREQAEKREREWEAQAAAEKAAQNASQKSETETTSPEPTITTIKRGPEAEIHGPKKVVKVTKTVKHNNGDIRTVETTRHDSLGPSVTVTHTKVCCVVM
jgi:hypothetical protein